MRFQPLPASFAAVALLACASAPRAPVAASPAVSSAAPSAEVITASDSPLERLLATDATSPLTPKSLRTPDGAFSARVLGAGDVTVEAVRTMFVATIPLGGAAPMECLIFPEIISLSNELRRVHERFRAELSRFELRGMNAGYVGEVPWLEVQALYGAIVPGGHRVGHIKLRAANVRARGILCIHNEPGYRRAFDQATRSLFVQDPLPAPSMRFLMSIDDQIVGFLRAMRIPGAETVEATESGMVISRNAQEFDAVDASSVERYTPTGELLAREETKNENGERSRYNVARQGASNLYRVQGRHLGQDISGDFTSRAPLRATTPAMTQAWEAFRTGALTPFRWPSYVASNPLSVSESTVVLDRVVDPQHVRMSQQGSGPARAHYLVGPQGFPEETDIPIGEHTLRFRLVRD